MTIAHKNNLIKKIVRAFNGKHITVSTFSVCVLGTQTSIADAYLDIFEGELRIESVSGHIWCRVRINAIEDITECSRIRYVLHLKDMDVRIDEYA